jgi:hypothetical protein
MIVTNQERMRPYRREQRHFALLRISGEPLVTITTLDSGLCEAPYQRRLLADARTARRRYDLIDADDDLRCV